MNGDVLPNRIRLLHNCSYFVFFSLQELDVVVQVGDWQVWQQNLGRVAERPHGAAPLQVLVLGARSARRG